MKQEAKLDRDILQIKMFMELESYGAALNHYMMGHNSVKDDIYRSLHDLATSPDLTLVPNFATYKKYFNDRSCADMIIQNVLTFFASDIYLLC